jgi:hypothetical protein
MLPQVRFHAIMLHPLGIDPTRLAVPFQGLDVRLTGVAGSLAAVAGTVVKDIRA